ncbi:hypothetical protein [Conexibacter sp. SYSU D00693]|uniref:hypothetical protein n=1 Tax=Conexibacter sp. SYSU D00693 TaxID=2812560 RepID=UPI00196A3A4B|nr:hypothetical protein [Conexibacter sp. SYSU D00693]
MTVTAYRRFSRYAVLQPAHLAVGLAAWSTDVPAAPVVLLWFALAVGSMWSVGLLQADLEVNPAVDDRARRCWRVAAGCGLPVLPAYWLVHVRPRRP